MTHKNLERYQFDVEEQEYIPDKENPDWIEITISFTYDENEYEITLPRFEPKQVADGRWEKHACRKIDKKVEEIEEQKDYDIPDLKGERIQNSGYDFTGPKDKDKYPERKER